MTRKRRPIRMPWPEYAPHAPLDVLEDFYRFDDVSSRGAGVLKMRWNYGLALYRDPGATLDGLREAVTTLEETERTARRVMGGAHPFIVEMEPALKNSRAALRAREATEAPPLK